METTTRSWVIALVVVALVLGALVVAMLVGREDKDEPEAAFTVALGSTGTGDIRPLPSGWRVELDIDDLPRLDDGRFYQAWFKADDGTLVPIGTFNEGTDVILWAGVSPVDYPTFTITRESADNDQASSGDRVFVGQVVPAD
jgi:hypothetical protein